MIDVYYLFMLGLKLIHVSEMGPRRVVLGRQFAQVLDGHSSHHLLLVANVTTPSWPDADLWSAKGDKTP